MFKDALTLEAVRSPDTLLNITKCLAFQVGNEVSVNEVAKTAGTDVKTTVKYLDLLEKNVYHKRKSGVFQEIYEMKYPKGQVLFLDNGIRNSRDFSI